MSQVEELAAVKRKIRALAAKTPSAGATHAESMAAMEKIGELLEQFNLSMNEVLLFKETCIKDSFDTTKRQSTTAADCCVNIGKLTSCVVWISRRRKDDLKIAFFGLESDVKMALHLCAVIDNAYESSFKEFQQSLEYQNFTGHRKVAVTNFFHGFSFEINRKLSALFEEREEREEKQAEWAAKEMKKRMVGASEEAIAAAANATTGTALIRLTKEKMISEEFKRLGIRLSYSGSSSSRRYDKKTAEAGSNAASKVNLSRPITSGSNGSFGGLLT